MVRIIGAGISSLSAAIVLAKAGEKVTIFEKNDFVGRSEGENFKAIRNYNLPFDQMNHFKELGFDLNFAKPINKIVKFAPSGRKMEVHGNGKPLFYSIRKGDNRDSFDYQLYEQALDNGVKVEFNSHKLITAGNIVGVNTIYKNIWASGMVFKGVNVDPETILFFMDNRYAPQGYIYILPYGKHEVCIAATSFDLNAPLPILLKRFIAENNVVSKMIDGGYSTNTFGGSAYFNLPNSAELNGVKFIGPAAGFIDPARGFGVKYAIESGYFAGKAIVEKKSYDTLWKEAFENELTNEFKRRLLLEKLTNNDYENLILDETINVKKYEKIPPAFKKLFGNIRGSLKLNEWRNKYDLSKLFT